MDLDLHGKTYQNPKNEKWQERGSISSVLAHKLTPGRTGHGQFSAHGRGSTNIDLKRQKSIFCFQKINIPLCSICLVQVYGAYTILRIVLTAMTSGAALSCTGGLRPPGTTIQATVNSALMDAEAQTLI